MIFIKLKKFFCLFSCCNHPTHLSVNLRRQIEHLAQCTSHRHRRAYIDTYTMSADNGAAAAVLDDSINNIPAPPPITKEEAIAAIKTRQEQRQAEIAAKRQQVRLLCVCVCVCFLYEAAQQALDRANPNSWEKYKIFRLFAACKALCCTGRSPPSSI